MFTRQQLKSRVGVSSNKEGLKHAGIEAMNSVLREVLLRLGHPFLW